MVGDLQYDIQTSASAVRLYKLLGFQQKNC